MRMDLLGGKGNFYKANLHCHSVYSDGKLTPEELKDEYMKRGYSIVAFTDHERFIGHNGLSGDGFLALNGYEAGIADESAEPGHRRPCYHFGIIALDGGPREVLEAKPAYGDHAGINGYIAELRRRGFAVIYNHPYWSLQTLDDYRFLQGLNAMEIFNYTCYHRAGIDGNQTQVYDTLLRRGRRLGCVAADDNHNRFGFDDPFNDSFGGFVMLQAEKLEYAEVMRAFVSGDYYASAGPLIEALSVGGGEVSVACSPAVRITLNTAGRRSGVANARAGETLTQARFAVDPEDVYIRLEVTDAAGRRANTRAYFLDELRGAVQV
ncbi:MAG TPA: PHP domain-containing protein [Clostridiales bacterium]|nr:MAG: hypothetical protein BWY37_00675 [Firmicutes bacterium ADurb.Bin262]HOU09279.1 PHP domain-containing protein [Clostridiales bacterium]HQK72230.1 PHP domain-containing protein [Clostridiales bacterium]